MKERLVVVIEAPEPANVDWIERHWQLGDLAQDLVKAGLAEVPVFTGKLEDAPEGWAYLLFTDAEELAQRAQQPELQQRLGRSLGTTLVPQQAAKLAEALGWIGALDNVGSSWFGPKRADPTALNFLFVKRAIAAQLAWPLHPMNGSENFASTRGIAMPLPKMIISYLRAALPVA
jgi:hypothetical protein